VLKCFIEAKDFIDIDRDILTKALTFVLTKQNEEGSFREDGRVAHSAMQVLNDGMMIVPRRS